MEKVKLLTVLLGVTLVLTLVNLYGTFNLYGEFDGITGNVVADVKAPQVAPPRAAPPSQPAPTVKVDMNALEDDDAIKGDPNAPVTIVEFSDFECAFCARFYQQTLNQIDEQYIKTGKVKLVYRDFPLGFHAQAQKAAEAAECAGEQDMFYEMHDLLFERGVTGGVASFKQYAAEIELNTEEFDQCLDSGSMAAEVKKDMADGQAAGITGTPGFFVNGEKIVGAQPFAAFQPVIEAALAAQ